MSVELLTAPDGHQCALHDMGGSGPALLLTHGNGLNAGMWSEVTPLLADRFHCHGLDFRGHGRAHSDDTELPVSRPIMVGDLQAAVDHLGGGPVLLAGHSLGGVIAVITELTHPGTLAAAWLFEPVLIPEGFGDNPTGSGLAEISRRRRNVFDSVDEAYERFVSRPPFSTCRPSAVRSYVDIGTYPLDDGTVHLSCHGVNEARIYESSVPQDFSTYERLDVPMLIARGGTADDGEVPAVVAPLIADAIPGAQFVTWPQVTHFGPMEDPELIAGSILSFFSGLGAIDA